MFQSNKIWQTIVIKFFKPIIIENNDESWVKILEILQYNPDIILTNNLPQKVRKKCAALNKTIEFYNLLKHFNFFEKIYFECLNYFSNLSNHHQHAEIRHIINGGDRETTVILWSICIFTSLISCQPVILLDNKRTTKVLSAIIENAANLLHIYLKLFIPGLVGTKIKTLKKYTHILIHRIAETNSAIIHIDTEKRSDFISLKDFLRNKKSKPASSITMVELCIRFENNDDRKFNVSDVSPQVICLQDEYYFYSDIKLNISPLIIQHYSRDKTTITHKFVEAISHLSQTKFYIEQNMIQKMKTLVQAQLQKLSEELKNVTDTQHESIQDLKLALWESSRQLYKEKHITTFLQQFFSKEKLNLHQIDINSQRALDSIVKLNSTLNLLFSKNSKEGELNISVRKLQKMFSHYLYFLNFLTYIDYLDQNNLTYIFFTPYADFRGRIYYKSEASPQSIWCFRHIYYYEQLLQPFSGNYPLYPYQEQFLIKNKLSLANLATIELLQAIGVIFKNKCLNTKTCEIHLPEILDLGYQLYLQYKDSDILTLTTQLDIKDAAELCYYINAFENEQSKLQRGYYIWKDTTASVIQHGGKLLGYNAETLCYLNLQNDYTAYDTYQYVINKIKDFLLPKYGADVINLLTRKLLKKLIMTTEYHVSFYTAEQYFRDAIYAQIQQDHRYKILDNRTLILDIFQLLNKDLISSLFFQQTGKQWFEENKSNALELGDLTMTHNYYEQNLVILYYEKTGKLTKTRQRLTNQALIPIWELEKLPNIAQRKTAQAAYVNAIHAYDAQYLRRITLFAKINRIELAAIHDGFGVAYYNVKWLIGAANSSFSPSTPTISSLTIII